MTHSTHTNEGVDSAGHPLVMQSDLVFSPKAVVYQTIADFEAQRIQFESEVGISNILRVMETEIPEDVVERSIDRYRQIIRKNVWYFPTSASRRTSGLLLDWSEVHRQYFQLAVEIFHRVSRSGMHSLVEASLYERCIRSETMRGWVGKRSSTGPDQLIEGLSTEVETLLTQAEVDDEVIDQVFHAGGLYHGDSLLMSAEEELMVLLRSYSAQCDAELTRENLVEVDNMTEGRAIRLLRDFSKYSLADFNGKLASYRENAAMTNARHDMARAEARQTLDGALRGLPDVYLRARLSSLLSEVRMLNFLNLNLEVKYSFKGWAGVMHGLVFEQVNSLPESGINVYQNLETLKGME